MAPKAPNATNNAQQKDLAATPQLSRPEDAAAAAPMTPKNFRNHPDMENFFRFIYDNDLRIEALHIIDEIIVERKARRKKGSANA